MARYIEAKTGVILERREFMFYFRGYQFNGLVNKFNNALYDDPEDSFCKYVGMKSSLEQGLIVKCN